VIAILKLPKEDNSMAESNRPLVGVFDDWTKADRAVEQLRSIGISDHRIHEVGKTLGADGAHVVTGRKGLPEERKPDFTRMGLSAEEASYYEEEYESGYVLVLLHPDSSREQAMRLLQSNGAYNYETSRTPASTQEPVPAKETGAMTPGMRPDDSSNSGIPVTAGGTAAATIDPITLEADLQHAQKVLSAKEQANEERASEQ
jgi:hypothetical protein